MAPLPKAVAAGLLVPVAAGAFLLARPGSRPAHAGAGTVPAAAASARAARPSRVEALTRVARARYSDEVSGKAAHIQLARVARDPVLLQALRAGDLPALRTAVKREQATPHVHISRLRVVRGGKVLADAGVVFVVAPSRKPLTDTNGHPLATLELSIQDVIGFVRYMHRNYPVDVVVRGQGPAHVRSSLPAATSARLPDRGLVTLAGRRYEVRSFHQRALGGEPVKVWILVRA